ncbi:MAG: aspartate aminotransferase family protein, partial [Actinomycetota bacterium]|nr:aspartate aminotransferase family protein [Actinomycetota bacterium]
MTTLEDLGIDDSALADELIAAAYDNDRRHVFHSWSAQGALKPVVIAGASGSRI